MEAKDIVEFEEKVSAIVGRPCRFEYIRYSGAKRLEAKDSQETDGLVKDYLSVFHNNYNHDFLISVYATPDPYGEGKFISSMKLYQLPGCCGVCVSTAAFVAESHRGKGINTLLNKFRIELAKHMKYTTLLCSDITGNAPSKKTLAKNGWKDIYQFTNRRTNNVVDLSVISLI